MSTISYHKELCHRAGMDTSAVEELEARIDAALAVIEGHRKAGERNASSILRSIELALKGEEE